MIKFNLTEKEQFDILEKVKGKYMIYQKPNGSVKWCIKFTDEIFKMPYDEIYSISAIRVVYEKSDNLIPLPKLSVSMDSYTSEYFLYAFQTYEFVTEEVYEKEVKKLFEEYCADVPSREEYNKILTKK